jgi:hypothetical protein
MPSGIFWRRATVAAVALMAGSALGVGVPSLVSHGPRNSAEAATATITLRVPSIPGVGAVDVTFAKLGPITDDIQNQQSCSAGKCTSTPTPVPPTISLHDPLATGVVTYKDMLAWEQAMRAGNPAGRATATLTLTSSTGTKIISYILENAWPTNLDVSTGTPQSASFTVTLTGDLLIAS